MNLLSIDFERMPQGIRMFGEFQDESDRMISINAELRGKSGMSRYLVVFVQPPNATTLSYAVQSNQKPSAINLANSAAQNGSSILRTLGVDGQVNAYVIDRISHKVFPSKHNQVVVEDSPLFTAEEPNTRFIPMRTEAMNMSAEQVKELTLKIYAEEKERREIIENLALLIIEQAEEMVSDELHSLTDAGDDGDPLQGTGKTYDDRTDEAKLESVGFKKRNR